MSAGPPTLPPARRTLRLSPAGRAALPLAGIALLLGCVLGGTLALLAATALALLFVAPLAAWLGARGLRLGSPGPLQVFAGEAFALELPVHNGARRFYARDVLFTWNGAERARRLRPAGHLAELAPGATQRLLLAGPELGRGRVRRLELAAWSDHPLGIVRARLSFALPCELLVFPRLFAAVDLTRLVPPAADLSDSRPRELRGDEELAGVREWRPGESVRLAHWKLSARRGRTILRERRAAAAPPLHVVLAALVDAPRASAGRRRAFEKAVSAAATLAEHRLRRGGRVLLTLASEDCVETIEGRGARGLWRMLAALAELECGEGDPLRAALAGLAAERASGLPATLIVAAQRRKPAENAVRARSALLVDVDRAGFESLFRSGRGSGRRPPVGRVAPS